MEAINIKKYTIEDIKKLPEEQRAELINGDMYLMGTPSRTHQRIVLNTARHISDFIERNKGDCEVNIAPFAVFLSNHDYVEPDIFVLCDKNKMQEDGCHGAPDFIIEVLSPGSAENDLYRKLVKYRAVGVKEYWIIDPVKRKVLVYVFSRMEIPETYTFESDIKVGIYDGRLTIRFADMLD